jgi:exodeoxyribonuclease V alpha subunit
MTRLKEITGQVEKISYESSDTGYTIARVKCSQGIVTVVGNLMSPPVGAELVMTGTWENHPKFGAQFRVVHFETRAPATLKGIAKYLGSGLVRGLGEKMAERIVQKFGKDTLAVLTENPGRLSEVEGIGEKRLAMIREAWDAQKNIRDVMIFLRSHGVGTGFAAKIYKRYGEDTIKTLKGNPYILATEIHGIGFRTADTIASSIGFSKASPFRVKAGILFCLGRLSEEGHVYYPMNPFLGFCVELLNLDRDTVITEIRNLAAEREIIVDERCPYTGEEGPPVYLSFLFFCERGIAARISDLMASPPSRSLLPPKTELAWLEQRLAIRLAERQKEAVTAALESKALVITGGPGTGKTTIINAILNVFGKHDRRILLSAPTGRAAKRMSEATGRPAKTIHRLLEFSFKAGGFQRNENKPLSCDVLVVDETSMIDVILMYQLLKAVPKDAVLILVGDVNQLPSVGPGNVLTDIIASEAVPVVRLTDIFRQAEKSRIIVNAHKINRGDMPHTGTFAAGDDYCFIEQDDPEKLAGIVVELVRNRIPRRFNLDPFSDIQVLTPMHKGHLGSENLNGLLQEALNGGGGLTLERGGKKFRVNDKVMQMRNNYDKDVYNGDIGQISAIDPENREVTVRFDGRDVVYEALDLDEISLAYAISVHKSQGSEYPAVVMPVTTQHYVLLQRNLLYTGITRGKELVVVVGTKKAVAMAVKNDRTAKRYTLLEQRLKTLPASRV